MKIARTHHRRGPASPRRTRHRSPRCEVLEDRRLLSLQPPPLIDPGLASQVLFGPERSTLEIAASPSSPVSRFYRFALDGLAGSDEARFDLAPNPLGGITDAALALYDTDGNLLVPGEGQPAGASLTAALGARQAFILGVFPGAAAPPASVLTVTTGPQVTNDPVRLDPATGMATRPADSGEDPFNAPADVDYYPLHLLNAGPGGTVRVTPTGLDVQVFATVFRRQAGGEWRPIDSRAGGPDEAVELTISPPDGRSLTDAEYLLAVAPRGFDSPARSYRIDVAAGPLLGPASLDAVGGITDVLLPPMAPGTARGRVDGTLAAGGALVQFRAPTDGKATLELESLVFDPLLSVYDAGGTDLLAVASRTGPGLLALELDVAGGRAYRVRVGDVGEDDQGAFALTVRTAYLPEEVPPLPATGIARIGPVVTSPALGGRYYRLTPEPGTDVIVIGADPGPAAAPVAPLIVVAGPDLAPMAREGAPGQSLSLAVDVTGRPGPLDVYVAATAGGGPVDVRVGALRLPRVLPSEGLVPSIVDIHGDLATTQEAGPFGAPRGLLFDQPPTGGPTTLSALGQDGSRPLLARYRDQGGQLVLEGFALPSGDGVSSLAAPLPGPQLYGAVAFALGFDGQGTTRLVVDGAAPSGIGVSMVPELDAGASPSSILRIEGVTLEHELQQHLWRTVLPYNILAAPEVTFEPKSPMGGLSAAIEVYRVEGGQALLLASGINLPGQPLAFDLPVSAADVPGLVGRTLLFRVIPRPGGLGDGIYTLRMTVPTSNPNPFLVTEKYWVFGDVAVLTELPPDSGEFHDGDKTKPFTRLIPTGEPVADIVQDQFGDGAAEGVFTSSSPVFDNPGALDVYRFWAVTPGPVVVRTIPIDPGINTNIRVYRAHRNDRQQVDYLTAGYPVLTSVKDGRFVTGEDLLPYDQDWFPADRSTIDAQLRFNDFDLLAYPSEETNFYGTGGGMYFVVVKNEEGTQGRYRIEVDTASFPSLGGIPEGPDAIDSYLEAALNQVAYIPPDGGAVTLDLAHVGSIPEFVGYFPVQVPAYHDGTLRVAWDTDDRWDVRAFDADGRELTSRFRPSPGARGFEIPDGPQTVFVRARELREDGTGVASLTISAGVTRPGGTQASSPPPAVLPAGRAHAMLPTNPFGDGEATGSLATTGEVATFAFQAAAGPLEIEVAPDAVGDVGLRWGVYVLEGTDGTGRLLAWDRTRVSGSQIDPGSTRTRLLLPEFRDPRPSPDFDYDRAPYHRVVVYVQAATGARLGGRFTVRVDSDGEQPMRLADHESNLIIDPLDGDGRLIDHPADSIGRSRTVDGLTWTRLVVPDGVQGRVQLRVSRPADGPTPTGRATYRYDIYDHAGNHVRSGLAISDLLNPDPAEIDLPEGGVGGSSFSVRVGLQGDALAPVVVRTSAALPKASGPGLARPPRLLTFSEELLGDDLFRRADPSPDGHFSIRSSGPIAEDPNLLESVAFWVGEGGPARFHVDLSDNARTPYIALYRGRFLQSGFGGENTTLENFELHLVDFANDLARAGDGTYHLSADLDPGMYVLRVVRSEGTGDAETVVDARLPAYAAETIVLDPEAGTSFDTHLRSVSEAGSAFGDDGGAALLDSFRTSVYRVVAPAGSKGGMTAKATNLLTDEFRGWLRPFEYGTARLVVWQRTDDGTSYTAYRGGTTRGASVLDPPDPPAMTQRALSPPGPATPGREYWIALNRNFLATKIGVSGNFEVPHSGTPDLVVESIRLRPAVDGSGLSHTVAEITVFNRGYASVPAFRSTVTFTSDVQPGQPLNGLEDPLSPSSSRTLPVPWYPLDPADQVAYAADVNHKVTELDETNNTASVALSTVDAHRPEVRLILVDEKLDGNADEGTWGRYVLGVPGAVSDIRIEVVDGDGAGDLYRTSGTRPHYANGSTGELPHDIGNRTHFTIEDFDFGRLRPTSSQSPNRIAYTARDRYGLESDTVTRAIQVVARPRWLDDGTSTITFDPATHAYRLGFRNALIDLHGSLSEILGVEVPLIGPKQNQFLVEILADGTASLDPSRDLDLPVRAHALLKVLDATSFEQTYASGAAPTDHVTVTSTVHVDGRGLEATVFDVGVRLTGLELVDFVTPEIPLVAIGVPGLASINANVRFGLKGSLDAAVTIGRDTASGVLGLVTPSFIRPRIEASATVSGEAEVLSFDLAEVSGSIILGLDVTYGLHADDAQVIPFGDFFAHDCLQLSADLRARLAASVIIFGEVWSYTSPPLVIPTSTCDHDDITQALAMVAAAAPAAAGDGVTAKGGDDLVGRISVDPSPRLAIDPVSGDALYVQVVARQQGRARISSLAVSRRTGDRWSRLTTLPGSPRAISSPALALTHDRAGTPAVVVYQATKTPGDVSGMTLNQFLADQDIRWRSFDGIVWGDERVLEADGHYDARPVVAFSGTGRGVVAWTHHKDAEPISAAGEFDRAGREIEVAVWDPAHHAWLPPRRLTDDEVSDARPAVFADEDGTLYVAWLRETPGGVVPYYSRSTGGAWSTPAALPLIGLPPGSVIRELAFGSDGPGRIHLLMSAVRLRPGDLVESRLYDRLSTTAGFGLPADLATIADGAGYSGLSTVRHPDGGLVASWQQSDGVVNEVFAARLGAAGEGPSTWSPPIRLTSGPDLEFSPSLAVDTDGRFQVVYQGRVAAGGTSSGPSPDRPLGAPVGAGVGTSSVRMLPGLAFSRTLAFPGRDGAPSGITALAEARLVNRGPAGDDVLIEYLIDPGTAAESRLGSRAIHLGPGQEYAISHAFPIRAGDHSYGIRASASGGAEVVGAGDNLTITQLRGLPDLAVTDVVLSEAGPRGRLVTAVVRNLSDQPVGPFAVTFYQGDPESRYAPAQAFGTVTVAGLAPFESASLARPWTAPAGGGDFMLVVRADDALAIAEATEFNNDGRAAVGLHPDAAAASAPGSPAIAAVLTDTSSLGGRNARVDVSVRNLGVVDLDNVPVRLLRSLDDGPFRDSGQAVIAHLPARSGATLSFVVDALAGRNRYRVVVDPDDALADADRSNNVAEATLPVRGHPDLIVRDIRLDPSNPMQGGPFRLRAAIANLGIAGARAIPIEVFAYAANPTVVGAPQDPPSGFVPGGLLVGRLTLAGLDPLASTWVEIPIDTSQLIGPSFLSVVLDRPATVLEVSDLNNVTSSAADFARAPSPFVVDTADDSVADDGRLSLREAILAANATLSPDTITFGIPGPGRHTIVPASALPAITDAVTIDGYTQGDARPNTRPVGSDAVLRIELDGSRAGAGADGLHFLAGDSTVRGLVINRFSRDGIRVWGASGNRIEGNFLGTDPTGTRDLGNAGTGIVLTHGATHNTIGGTAPAARNVLSGNEGQGVTIAGPGSTGNLVQGNYIGLDASGTADLGNSGHGVNILNSPGNTIGGTAAGAGNVLSGNHGGMVIGEPGATRNVVLGNLFGTDATGTALVSNDGAALGIWHASGNTIGGTVAGARNVLVTAGAGTIGISGAGSTGNRVLGNFIGTNIAGTATLGHSAQGVNVTDGASRNTIGGTAAGAGNLISGHVDGIWLSGAGTTGNLVQGNALGVDVTGTRVLRNSRGITIFGAPANQIGGTDPGARNVIAGSQLHGVLIQGADATGNLVLGNSIGTDATGTRALGNAAAGVSIAASGNTIGAPGAGNTIAYNGIGIVVVAGTGNPIRGNSIHSNIGLGLDLGGDGVTPDDLGDTDIGPNDFQNAPVHRDAVVGTGETTVEADLNGSPNTTFILDFYASVAPDPSGFGEGQRYLGSAIVTTDGSGILLFRGNLAAATIAGEWITVTATDHDGNTSEFSNAFAVEAPPSLVLSSVPAVSAPGSSTPSDVEPIDMVFEDAVFLAEHAFARRTAPLAHTVVDGSLEMLVAEVASLGKRRNRRMHYGSLLGHSPA